MEGTILPPKESVEVVLRVTETQDRLGFYSGHRAEDTVECSG